LKASPLEPVNLARNADVGFTEATFYFFGTLLQKTRMSPFFQRAAQAQGWTFASGCGKEAFKPPVGWIESDLF